MESSTPLPSTNPGGSPRIAAEPPLREFADGYDDRAAEALERRHRVLLRDAHEGSGEVPYPRRELGVWDKQSGPGVEVSSQVLRSEALDHLEVVRTVMLKAGVTSRILPGGSRESRSPAGFVRSDGGARLGRDWRWSGRSDTHRRRAAELAPSQSTARRMRPGRNRLTAPFLVIGLVAKELGGRRRDRASGEDLWN